MSELIIGFHIATGIVIAGIAAAAIVSRSPMLGLINVPVGLFMLGLPLLLGYASFTTVLVQSISLGALVAAIAVTSEITKGWMVEAAGTSSTVDVERTDIPHRGRRAV